MAYVLFALICAGAVIAPVMLTWACNCALAQLGLPHDFVIMADFIVLGVTFALAFILLLSSATGSLTIWKRK